MSKRALVVIGVIAALILVGGLVLPWFFGPQMGYGMMGGGGFGRGMMGGWMHPGYGGWSGGVTFAWPMLVFGLFRLLGWAAQIAIIAVIVAWLIKPRMAQPPAPPATPPQQ